LQILLLEGDLVSIVKPFIVEDDGLALWFEETTVEKE
jgi:hypothetical protein